VVVDERVADVGEGQPAQRGNGVVGAGAPGGHVVEERSQRGFVHRCHIVADHRPFATLAEVTRPPATVLA
jgi:hypothetical protein